MTTFKIDSRILSAAEKLAGIPDPANASPPGRTTIDAPGLYEDFVEAAYQGDPCPEPSASRTVIDLIAERTPAHAYTAHPKLNPAYEEKTSDQFDLGTAVHTMILSRGRRVIEARWPDWRTNESKAFREAAREQRLVPILTHQLARVMEMAAAIGEQLPDHGLTHLFDHKHGRSEVCAAWIDPVGGWSRMLIDWIENDTFAVTDLKTTSLELTVEAVGRHCANMHYEVQQAFYERGLVHLFPELAGRIRFRFLFCEIDPPYAILPVILPADALAKGSATVERGMRLWAAAKASGKWPRFLGGDVMTEYPPWTVAEYAK